jgi:hypothetical protein
MTPPDVMLEARLKALLHKTEITELQARYGALCDAGYPPDEIASLFVEDGVWQSEPNGVLCRGRREIAAHFASIGPDYAWAMHINVPLHVRVADDQRSAVGAWYLLMPCVEGDVSTRQAAWLAGRYDNEFVFRDGEWMFNRIHISFGLMSGHLADWAVDRYSVLRSHASRADTPAN